MKNILITGGAGFIGSNFIRYLLAHESNARVVNLDALTYAGSVQNLRDLPDPARYEIVHGDICDRSLVEEVFSRYTIDTVVHFAAESHVDRSILGPGLFIQTNVVGTFTLLDVARKYWLGQKALPVEAVHFHHVSTDEVFGTLGPNDPAFTETTPYAPRSPYAASKASSDHLVRAYFNTYSLPVTITNCSNNYGPYQFLEKLIPLMIMNAVTGKPLPVYGDGKQIRDWLYVEDHCEAILTVLKRGRLGETYNVGGDNQPTNLEIIHTICAIVDELLPNSPYTPRTQLITSVTDRPGHDRRYDVNITKIYTELGWAPKRRLQDGLRETIIWYLNHPEWLQAITSNSDIQSWINRNYTTRGEAK